MARKRKVWECFERAKGLYDGACTLLEMAERLELEAARLRRMHTDGIILVAAANDDYAFMVTDDERVAVAHGLHAR